MIIAIWHWLYANVVGNLTASALWAAPALLHLHRKLNRQHDQVIKSVRKANQADKLTS